MKRSRRIILISLLTIVVVGLTMYFLDQEEPDEQGKSTREWLARLDSPLQWDQIALVMDQIGTNKIQQRVRTGKTEAFLAVERMGTNMFPVVIEELGASDSKWKLALVSLASKQRLIRFPQFTSASMRRQRALSTLRVLGRTDECSASTSWILQHMASTMDNLKRTNLITALSCLGPSAFPTLRFAATNDANPDVRKAASEALRQVGPK